MEIAACSGGGSDEAEVDIEFHGVLYTLSIHKRGDEVLEVEIEDKDSFERWRGEFAAKYVEDITSKTGNFKKFAVFVRMLQSAVLQQSDAVYVDLLTYQDLELLKSRKAAAASGPTAAGTNQQQRQLPANNKRYLILTYASEFDRVHYPLPLLHEGQPDPQRLRGVIQQLRQQLEGVLAGQQRQQQSRQQLSSARQRSGQAPSAAEQSDAAVMSSRLEVMAAQLERERAEHKRERRRSARQLRELQEELSRGRDVSRQLRLKLKACEQELSDAQGREQQLKAAAAAAGPASGGRRSNGRVAGPYNASSGWTNGSSYLRGGPGPGSSRQYNKFPTKESGTAAAGGSTAASSRGSSPASTRAASPGYTRAWAQNATPPRPPRPSSAPPKQRFDPTEYVRQRQARQQQSAACHGSGSRGSSPARSTGGGSAASTPRASSSGRGFAGSPAGALRRSSGADSSGSAGMSRQGSLERRRGAAVAATGTGGYVRPTRCSSSGGGSMGAARGGTACAAGGVTHRSSSRDRLGAVYGASGATAGCGGRSSRSSSRQGSGMRDLSSQQPRPLSRDGAGAASPGRALQGVKDKLTAFMAKQQQGQPGAQHCSPRQQGVLTVGHAMQSANQAAAFAAVPAAAGELAEQGSRVFEDASSEIANIDQRLHALQDFLRKAKSSVAAS